MNNEQLTMNNERRAGSLVGILAFFFLISFLGCGNSLTADKGSSIPAGKGAFSLTLSRGRTILPADTLVIDDFAVYNLVFTPAISGYQANFDRTAADLPGEIFLNPGTYNLVINAYREIEKTTPLARGTLNGIVITAGQKIARDVTLEAVLSDGAGTFIWDITVPQDVTNWSMIIAPTTADGTAEETVTEPTGSLTLNAGLYNLTVNLESPKGKVVWKELLYVYQNLESEFTYTFTDDHFSKSIHTVTFDTDDGSPIGEKTVLHGGAVYKPAAPTKAGFAFLGWYTDSSFANAWNFNTAVTGDITLYAKLVDDTLTDDGSSELVYLQDGAVAIYKFDIGSKTLNDYNKLSFDFKISAAGLEVWKTAGIRHLRLYGVYSGNETITTDSNGVKILNLANFNAPYILKNPAQNEIDDIRDNVTANEWKNVEYSLSTPYYDGNTDNLPGTQTGTVYFGLGISCQGTNDGKNREQAFLQLIKNIKLHPVNAVDGEVTAEKPAAAEAQFVAYNTSIVLEWRGDPTTNLANPPLPELPQNTPVDPPADADLREVVLSASGPGFTYINNGSANSRGWTSPGGNPTGQSYSGAAGTVAFDKFKKAWYLVVETTTRPTGGVQLVWMGNASGWSSNAVTSNIGEPVEGAFEIIPAGFTAGKPDSNILKFFLPGALFQYSKYFQNNTSWAALCIQYYGANGANLNDLGITKAYLLVDKNDL